MGLAAGEGARPTPPPARPPASPELPPTPARARPHWLRRAAAAARTGRPGCQSPAGGGGGAPCRGGFLFAWASAGNNERDPPGARGPLRPGTRRPGRRLRRRAPPAPRGPPARRGRRVGTVARWWRYPPASPPPPAPPPLLCPGGAGPGLRSFEVSPPGLSLRAGDSRGSGAAAEQRPAGRHRRRALSLRR